MGFLFVVCFSLDIVLFPCGVFNITEGYPLVFLFIWRVYSLQFIFLLDFVLRSCGVLHITLFECVRAVYKEAFSVNFIVDRFSLPYLFYVICVFSIILFYFIYLLSYWVSFSQMNNTFWNALILPSFFLPLLILVLFRDVNSTFFSCPCSIQLSCASCS